MLALYKGSVEFMLSQDRMLGDSRPNKEASQLARVKHFTSNLPSLGQDMADAQAVLAELEKTLLHSQTHSANRWSRQ